MTTNPKDTVDAIRYPDAWSGHVLDRPEPDLEMKMSNDRFVHAKISVSEVNDLHARIAELEALINTSTTHDWFDGVHLEAAHQIERWGSGHDVGKEPLDWFWLIGYLAQKATASAMSGDEEKAKHHTISTGAALLNWHRSLTGENTRMRPGTQLAEAEATKGTPANG